MLKKMSSYKPLSKNVRLKNQAKTIRQQREQLIKAEAKASKLQDDLDYTQNELQAAYEMNEAGKLLAENLGSELNLLKQELEEARKPWWKKVLKCK